MAKSKAWLALAANSWQEDGFWWAENDAGQLYWLQGQSWKKYPPTTFKSALGQAVGATSRDFMGVLPYVPQIVKAIYLKS